jgi:hypothetical protein
VFGLFKKTEFVSFDGTILSKLFVITMLLIKKTIVSE